LQTIPDGKLSTNQKIGGGGGGEEEEEEEVIFFKSIVVLTPNGQFLGCAAISFNEWCT